MKNTSPVGFDRTIELGWLDLVAELQAEGLDRGEIRSRLDDVLQHLPVGAPGSARRKTLTVLLHIWVNASADVRKLRDEGLRLLAGIGHDRRLPLHWGMAVAAYPFVYDVAAHTGRLLSLQEGVTQAQIRRRLVERWGDRELLARSVRHVLRTFVRWGVLKDTQTRGTYGAIRRVPILPADGLTTWLLEAVMIARRSSSADLRGLANDPALFPFSFEISRVELQRHPRLELATQGGGNETLIRSSLS
jgi:hypothetical protein